MREENMRFIFCNMKARKNTTSCVDMLDYAHILNLGMYFHLNELNSVFLLPTLGTFVEEALNSGALSSQANSSCRIDPFIGLSLAMLVWMFGPDLSYRSRQRRDVEWSSTPRLTDVEN